MERKNQSRIMAWISKQYRGDKSSGHVDFESLIANQSEDDASKMQKLVSILAAVRRSEPKKKRVTFFISETTKAALAKWCQQNAITESSAIEEMIKDTVPSRFFKDGR